MNERTCKTCANYSNVVGFCYGKDGEFNFIDDGDEKIERGKCWEKKEEFLTARARRDV